MSDGVARPVGGRETIAERFTYHCYATAERVSRALPERAGRRLARAIASVGYALVPPVRERVAANQAQVLGLPIDDPLVQASTREAFRLYLRYWVDSFRLAKLSPEEVRERTEVVGIEHLREALAGGSGAIAVLPHTGNWDAAGAWIATERIRIVSVAEELRPPRLFELFLRHRREIGMEIIGLSGNGGVGRRLAAELADGAFVALVADRDLNGRGVEVEMFGRARSLPAGPALLSLTSGAPLLVCALSTTRRGWRIVIEPPLTFEPTGDRRADVTALTRAVAVRFEAAIAANPADWHVFQQGWPEATPSVSVRTGSEA